MTGAVYGSIYQLSVNRIGSTALHSAAQSTPKQFDIENTSQLLLWW